MDDTPRLYRELAEWWPLLSAPEEYAEEAEDYRRLLVEGSGRRGPRGPGARLGRRQQRLAPEGPLPAHARRPLAADAGGEPTAQPRVRARRGRHAFGAARADVRRGVRARRDRVHDDRGRPARGVRDGVRAHPAGRGGAVRPRLGDRDLRAGRRPRRARRARPRAALPRVDVGSGPGRHDGADGPHLRVPRTGRVGARRARRARLRAVPSGDVARADRRTPGSRCGRCR